MLDKVDSFAAGERLRLLSYNIQSGMETTQHRDYITKSWQHFLPHPHKKQNLERIAAMIAEYDIVGLQEIDAGSLRSAFVDQTAYLAHHAGFYYWHKQVNRDIGHLGQYGHGKLNRTLNDQGRQEIGQDVNLAHRSSFVAPRNPPIG
ncbi:MAG: hypothetical protein P8Z31_02170 [Gammaproteobacteria bacterium]